MCDAVWALLLATRAHVCTRALPTPPTAPWELSSSCAAAGSVVARRWLWGQAARVSSALPQDPRDCRQVPSELPPGARRDSFAQRRTSAVPVDTDSLFPKGSLQVDFER